MRRRTKIILVLGAVVLLALWWSVFRSEKEPEYKGKKLSEWMIQCLDTGTITVQEPDPLIEEAYVAIRGIGTNAIPYLLNWIDYEIAEWVLEVGDKLGSVFEHIGMKPRHGWPNRAVLSYVAANGFEALGPTADSAAPELSRLLHKHKGHPIARRIATALGSLGTNGCKQLVDALGNADVKVRRDAAFGLWFTTNKAKAFAVPALLASLKDADEHVATASASSRLLKLRPDLAIPALIAALSDPRANLQKSAIHALGRLGSQASNAMPALLPLLNPTNDFRFEATNAIRKIDASVLPK